MTLKMLVKVTHNSIRLEALLDAYSLRTGCGFTIYFSSYRVTTVKFGQFQALQGQMTLKLQVKVTHNLIRFETLLGAYSVQIWCGFALYFSSYRVTTAKLGQFQALQGQITLKMQVKVTHNLIRLEALLYAYYVRIWSGFAEYFLSYRVTTAKSSQFQALRGQMTLKMQVKVTHNLIRFEALLDAYSVRIWSGF